MRGLIGALGVALALGACKGDPAPEEGAGERPTKCEDDVPETRIGMAVEGANLRAELIEADYLPVLFGLNTWQVRFTDGAGEPVDDVMLAREGVFLFMPGHGHTGGRDPKVEALGDGLFEITDIEPTMDGFWEFQFSPKSESVGNDYLVFKVCVGDTRTHDDDVDDGGA